MSILVCEASKSIPKVEKGLLLMVNIDNYRLFKICKKKNKKIIEKNRKKHLTFGERRDIIVKLSPKDSYHRESVKTWINSKEYLMAAKNF